MLLGFGYLYVCYALFLFPSKSRKYWIKKKPVGQSFVIFCCCCLFLLKVGSVGPIDQQINFALP